MHISLFFFSTGSIGAHTIPWPHTRWCSLAPAWLWEAAYTPGSNYIVGNIQHVCIFISPSLLIHSNDSEWSLYKLPESAVCLFHFIWMHVGSSLAREMWLFTCSSCQPNPTNLTNVKSEYKYSYGTYRALWQILQPQAWHKCFLP